MSEQNNSQSQQAQPQQAAGQQQSQPANGAAAPDNAQNSQAQTGNANGKPVSQLQSQPGTPQQPAQNNPYRPEGLAQHFCGTSDKETIDKMAAALKGYRDKDAAKQLPKDVNAYADFTDVQLPDTIKAYMKDIAGDPVFKTAAEAAMKHGVPRNAMQEIITAAYTSAAENGLLEPPVDIAKERSDLLPSGYENKPKEQQDAAIDRRLQDNADYINLMVKQGRLEKAVAENALGMLMDSASGNKFLEFVRFAAGGNHNSQPYAGNGMSPNAPAAQLREQLKQVEAKRGTLEWDQGEYDALMQRYKAQYGE